MNFVIKTMKEYKATIAYFKKNYPKAYNIIVSITKSVLAGIGVILGAWAVNPSSVETVSLGALGWTLLRLIATVVSYQISTEVKTSKI